MRLIEIDIYGFSDKSQTLKVSPDGTVRYPNIGLIKLAGLNLDEAKAKLSASLSKIYPGLKGGNTSLQITLGQIRNIKVKPGSEIYVPVKAASWPLSASEILGISTGSATLATVAITISNLTK